MAYSVAAGSILEQRFVGQHNGQTVMSVLHYKFTSGSAITDGRAAAVNINALTQAATGFYFQWIGVCSQELLDVRIVSQWITPARYTAVVTIPAIVQGGVAAPAFPQNVSIAITKTADQASRHARGTLHMPAVPIPYVDAGMINGAGEIAYAACRNEMFETIVLGTGQTMTPVIFNRANPDLSIINTGGIIQDTARVMRRRTVRVGI